MLVMSTDSEITNECKAILVSPSMELQIFLKDCFTYDQICLDISNREGSIVVAEDDKEFGNILKSLVRQCAEVEASIDFLKRNPFSRKVFTFARSQNEQLHVVKA